ncbi:PTS sugar transporter subunit IIA [Traorella massiliensis]|uniref:PTS sugar transporter subunit IIA n=1 Tax=Traorella massiliensis TaxID=1903263 RepID=UPI00235652CE|nr:hypothetical protein [Traorella massiliensis]
MNTFIIASHSTFAEGLYNCLKFFKFDIDNVYYINAYVDDMEFEKSFIELVEKLRDKNLIVLTDMPGGSVNVVCLQLMKKYQYHLISGVNFPLVLELIFQNEQIDSDVIRSLIETGRQQMVYMNDLQADETEDNDEL